MKRQLLYITLLLIQALFFSCEENHDVSNEVGMDYMQLNTRTGGDNDSNKPIFIFWESSKFNAPGFGDNPTEPYVYRFPEGMIDDYNVGKSKYNTREVYPEYAAPVYAVGISPASIPGATPTAWKSFNVAPAIAGLVDIQCAPIIEGNEHTHFSDPLVFTHQLAKLEFKGYCGTSMKESDSKFVNVKDIEISISSDKNDQWKWFPEKLTWNHGGIGVGQYKVSGYTAESPPATPIVATVPSPEIVLLGKIDITEANAKPLGNFYLMPGFNAITIRLKATYIDETLDKKTENVREWEEFLIENIDGTSTKAGNKYTINLCFERNRIVLGASLVGWPDEDIVN